jgi:hypothetical protein
VKSFSSFSRFVSCLPCVMAPAAISRRPAIVRIRARRGRRVYRVCDRHRCRAQARTSAPPRKRRWELSCTWLSSNTLCHPGAHYCLLLACLSSWHCTRPGGWTVVSCCLDWRPTSSMVGGGSCPTTTASRASTWHGDKRRKTIRQKGMGPVANMQHLLPRPVNGTD